jgi:uncharacterized protein
MVQAVSESREGMRIDWDVPILMDDGVTLRADVFRPDGGGRFPAIVTYGPYAKGLHFEDGYPASWRALIRDHPEVAGGTSTRHANWEVVDPEKWVPDGYVCVRIDSRGAGRSEGKVDPWSAREARDFHDCIEWAAGQPWSNGKVGINGVSYYAVNAWQVAALQPPHLSAICVWEGGADFYRDFIRQGGILCTFLFHWYRLQVKSVQNGVGERGFRSRVTGELVAGPVTLPDEELAANRVDFERDIKAHPLDDAWYRSRSVDWSRVKVPLLSAGSWGGNGFHLRGNIEGFMRAASPQKWLEMHALEHWTHFYTDYGVALQKKFFGHFLKGDATGWDHQPPVQLMLRHPGHRFELRAENEWPLARTQWTTLQLGGDLSLRESSRSLPEAQVQFEAPGDGLTFWSQPLEADTEICGPITSRLWISSSTSDADLFVVLRVFSPEGKEVHFVGVADPHTPIAQGWLRASHRKLHKELSLPFRPFHAHDEIWPLEPGRPYCVEVEIWPTHIAVPAGYRVAFSVLGHDYEYGGEGIKIPNFANPMKGCGPAIHDDPDDRPPSVYAGRTTLHVGGPFDSALVLPVVPPQHAAP